MLAIVGTVPDSKFPLTMGKVVLQGRSIWLGGRAVPVNRGTPALLAAACSVLEFLGHSGPFGYLVGDLGLGQGSRRLYWHLAENLGSTQFHTIAFHYLQPDVDWHNRVLFAVEDLPRKPLLIADAGFMYAAKMSGQAPSYDLFTPDVGELAFLADEAAPHPFYTRGFILHEDNRVPELASRAYLHDNAATYLLVKGARDHLIDRRGVLAVVEEPSCEAMEAIGGTGDTLTGIVAALCATGMDLAKAAALAAWVNRLAGCLSDPTPATQIAEIIERIPSALAKAFQSPEFQEGYLNGVHS